MKLSPPVLALSLSLATWVSCIFAQEFTTIMEEQITCAPHGHILTNTSVWSPDGNWIVYDVRSDAAGEIFDGRRIERVHVHSKATQVLFESRHGACCGVVTASPVDDRVVFIHGPENPAPDWQYAAYHRRGVLVRASRPGTGVNLDARDIVAPFTPGALRGGTHVHTFSGDGQWLAFTYEDHVLADPTANPEATDLNQRNVGISVPACEVLVPSTHPRNHAGSHFTVLATCTTNHPRPGSDEISRAFSDAWIGRNGYVLADGRRQSRAIAFQGHVQTQTNETISEVFVVDLPDDVTAVSESGPLQGTNRQRPQPPLGTRQRRITFTVDRRYPGIQGVRHWLRSSPDGERIAFLMKSDDGIAQLWTVSPRGGAPRQLTHNRHPIESAFSWSPNGRWIAHVMDDSVCVTSASSGQTLRLTEPRPDAPLRPEACVFSPDGSHIAYVRRPHATTDGKAFNQIYVLELSEDLAQTK